MSDVLRRERRSSLKVPLERLALLAMLAAASAPLAHAEGHGPAFGLATPTLPRGQWSSDTALMDMDAAGRDILAYREVLGYGITPDLEALFAFPLKRPDERIPASLRGGAMMGSMEGLEGSMIWRFQRTEPGVGVRRESSLIAGIAGPLNARQAGVPVGPSFHLAVVTGYVSRSIYWWVGAGMLQIVPRGGGHPGALYYASGVFGYRPPLFRHNLPRPDWRIFIESLIEHRERDRIDGHTLAASGGDKVLVGPSVLGLFGRWGIEAGVLFPAMQSLPGNQPREGYRAKLVLTYWF